MFKVCGLGFRVDGEGSGCRVDPATSLAVQAGDMTWKEHAESAAAAATCVGCPCNEQGIPVMSKVSL